MEQRQFRIAVAGLGMMGQSLAETCRAEAGALLVAGCDIDAAQRLAWGHAHAVPQACLYDDLASMLDEAAPDVLIVATHAPLHYQQVMLALHRGVHVLCEKPLALNLAEADQMVETSDARGLKLAVNHIKRASHGNAIARNLIQSGAIGTPSYIRGEGKGGRWAGSELMEMGTHLFDWLRLLAGDPAWLFAHITQDGRTATVADIMPSLALPYRERDCGLVLGERAFCALGLPGGLHADVSFLSQPDGSDTGYGLDICGTEGTLALRRSVGTDIFLQRATHRGPLGTPAWEQIPVDEFAGLEPPAAPRDAAGERLALQRRLLRDLLQAIAEDRAPESSGHAARQALELSMAVWESQREGRPVALPLGNRAHPLERWRSSAP